MVGLGAHSSHRRSAFVCASGFESSCDLWSFLPVSIRSVSAGIAVVCALAEDTCQDIILPLSDSLLRSWRQRIKVVYLIQQGRTIFDLKIGINTENVLYDG